MVNGKINNEQCSDNEKSLKGTDPNRPHIGGSVAAYTVSLLHQTQKAAKKSKFLRGFLFTAYSSAFSLSVLS